MIRLDKMSLSIRNTKVQSGHRIQGLSKGFTIVELLVVIVVIGILASITVVSYTGVQNKAKTANVTSTLRQIVTKIELYKVDNSDAYPVDLDQINYTDTASTTTQYYHNNLSSSYCIDSRIDNVAYHVTETIKTPTVGSCTVAVTFAKAFGGAGYDDTDLVFQTADGGYAMSGSTNSYGAGGYDAYIAKYDANGAVTWSRTWGGTGDDYGGSIIQTSDNGFIIAGTAANLGAGGNDMFVAKFTSDGTLSWDRTWGSTGSDSGYMVINTSDGGFAVLGRTSGLGAGNNDIFIAKYTSDGTLSWDKTWGNTYSNIGYAIVQTSDGGYAVTGYSYSPAMDNDMILIKFAADGSETWNKAWGGLGSDWGNTLIQTSDNGYALVGGGVSFGSGGWDAHVVKYASDGIVSWAKTWGSTANDGGNSVMQAADGGIVTGGWTYNYGAGDENAYLAKYSSTGSLDWSRLWGSTGADSFNKLRLTSDGFIATGATTSYGAGGDDALFVRYAADGTMKNCDPSICRGVSGSITTPAATVGTVTVTVGDPTAITGDPSATVNNNPAFTNTDVVVR